MNIQQITDNLFENDILLEEFEHEVFIKYVTLNAPENIDNLIEEHEDEFKESLTRSADSHIFVGSSIARDEREEVEIEFSDDTINILFHCKRVGEFE
jgi:hypothetical protein